MRHEIEDFYVHLQSERGLSPHTLSAYTKDVRYFFEFMSAQGCTSWNKVSQDHVVQFFSSLRDQEYASTSIARMLIALKMFFRFLEREGQVEFSCLESFETPKIWQSLPEVLCEEEVLRLLAQPDTSMEEGARDRAVLEVLYGSGLRVSELCGLKLLDVDDHFLRVTRAKGEKQRVVPIGTRAIAAIDHYLSFRNAESEWLFLSRGHPLDRIAIWKMIKRYAKIAGVSKRVSPHTFRHSFATHLLKHGANVRVIQEMLGHASVASTDRYTRVDAEQLKTAFHACHPRSKPG